MLKFNAFYFIAPIVGIIKINLLLNNLSFLLISKYKLKSYRFNMKNLHLMLKTKIFYLNRKYLLLFSKVGIVIANYINEQAELIWVRPFFKTCVL